MCPASPIGMVSFMEFLVLDEPFAQTGERLVLIGEAWREMGPAGFQVGEGFGGCIAVSQVQAAFGQLFDAVSQNRRHLVKSVAIQLDGLLQKSP